IALRVLFKASQARTLQVVRSDFALYQVPAKCPPIPLFLTVLSCRRRAKCFESSRASLSLTRYEPDELPGCFASALISRALPVLSDATGLRCPLSAPNEA